MNLKLKLLEVPQDKRPPCPGLFFRCYIYRYLSSYFSIEDRRSLRFLKSISCTGCPTCDGLWEEIKMQIEEGVELITDIEKGKLYQAKIKSTLNIEDDPELYFQEVSEKPPIKRKKKK